MEQARIKPRIHTIPAYADWQVSFENDAIGMGIRYSILKLLIQAILLITVEFDIGTIVRAEFIHLGRCILGILSPFGEISSLMLIPEDTESGIRNQPETIIFHKLLVVVPCHHLGTSHSESPTHQPRLFIIDPFIVLLRQCIKFGLQFPIMFVHSHPRIRQMEILRMKRKT